jgi:endonuclease G
MPARKRQKTTARSTRPAATKSGTRPAGSRSAPAKARKATNAKPATTSGPTAQPSTSAQMIEVMRRFIRSRSGAYLEDRKITSVGIGWNPEREGEPEIQFTVDRKVRAEAESLKPVASTAAVEFEGIALPTRVVERSFKPSYLLLQPEALLKDPRKQRQEELVPGLSIGSVRTSAGTLGTFVLDQRSRERVLLSNWHVLHTATGAIGDSIVQPGPFDDNRITANVIGKLRRSHLGAAGDCAIASIESRDINPEIFALKTRVRRVGRAELGDRVVKSGRTTGVTFGVVTRVEVMTRMDYDDGVVEDIGGFEIGMDPARRPLDGEISKGGDSGAAWLAVEKGKPTDIMLGLHFAGESDESDTEFALACNAHSVFEKLEIEPLAEDGEAPAMALSEAERPDLRTGFNRSFLRFAVPAIKFTDAVTSDLVAFDSSREIRYTHFSVWLSKTRRFPRLVAWNIDGANIKKVDRKGIPFVKDERGNLATFQIGDELYANNPLDRGHVARRADLCWGVKAEAHQANRDSFFFSNITPQHERFNQSLRRGLWGRLEDAIFEDVAVGDLRVSLLGGPLLRSQDPLFAGVRIPTEFWKAVAYTDDADGQHKVRAFILTQRDLVTDLTSPESLELDEFRVFQVPLGRIEKETGLTFTKAFKALDSMPPSPEALGARVRRIDSERDLFA